MGECRLHQWPCPIHEGGVAALCSHAAFGMEEQLRKAAADLRSWNDNDVERLKQIAVLERRVETITSEYNEMCKHANALEARLAQAEAREAAMREALIDLQDHHCSGRCDEDRHRKMMEKVNAALSPDAGRAPQEAPCNVCGNIGCREECGG